MFSTRVLDHEVNRLHLKGLRALQIMRSRNDMLSKSNDTTIHVKNIQNLMIGFYKYIYGLFSSTCHNERIFFKRILKHNLQSCRVTLLLNPKAKYCDTDTVAYKTV